MAASMKVDFNSLRRKAGNHYNNVVNMLNRAESTGDMDFNLIRNSLDSLRSDLVGILCCYEENNPDCIEIDMDLLSAYLDGDDDD